MIPMEPGPEDFARILSERRTPYGDPAPQAWGEPIAHYAHSRTGLLTRYIRNLADRVDPTGRQRRELR